MYPLHVLILSLNAAIFDTMAKCFVCLIGPKQDKHGKVAPFSQQQVEDQTGNRKIFTDSPQEWYFGTDNSIQFISDSE